MENPTKARYDIETKSSEENMRSSLLVILSMTSIVACTGELPTNKQVIEKNSIIQVDVTEVDFGDLLMGSLASETIVISNVGEENLIIDGFVVTAPFTTPSGGFEIEPGKETPISVQFIPIDFTQVEGSITILSNDIDHPEYNIPIYGSTITDIDSDGVMGLDAGGTDCNDDNPNIYPGAIDEWYDGIDSDCDGKDDYDQDQDGFQTIVWNDDPANNGGDCQDNNPNMYPGAPDQWYDGIDSNCDGVNDYDQDGDGSGSLSHSQGSDCDDSNPDINANGVEKVNSLDDDCNGAADDSVPGWNADLIYEGTSSNDKTGWSIVVGDVNSDGIDDLLVSSKEYGNGTGSVAVFIDDPLPTTGSTIADSNNIISGAQSPDEAGTGLSFLSDFGTGVPVVAIGAPGANSSNGSVYLLSGTEAINGDINDYALKINGLTTSHFGRGLTEDIDFDGDGLSDLFGNYRSATKNYYWLLYGDSAHSGTMSAADVDAKFSTNGTHDNTWRHMPNAGDLDGNGLVDVVHCDQREVTCFGCTGNEGDYFSSQVNVLWGENTRYATSGTTNLSYIGTNIMSASGNSVSGSSPNPGDGYQVYPACGIMPDWTGDGKAEFWAFFTQSESSFTGIYVFEGSGEYLDGLDLDPNAAPDNGGPIFFIETGFSGPPVASFRPVGDWDDDGISEVGVSFGTSTTGGAGEAWMISSQMEPGLEYTNNDVLVTINGDEDYFQANYGNVLSVTPGDINNDGLSDWITSDWGFLGGPNNNNDKTGSVYISFQVE
jgi:hypothetical protein